MAPSQTVHCPDPERPQILFKGSLEAQELRRKMLSRSNVLIVRGGGGHKEFIYDRLRELGVNLYIMDSRQMPWQKLAEEGKIDGFIELDLQDSENIEKRALLAIEKSNVNVRFDAVTTFYEEAIIVAARIGEALGVATSPVKACEKARNKRMARIAMREAGMPVPKFAKICAEADIPAACSLVGFPAVLKPSLGTASIGVVRVNSVDETIAYYDKMLKMMDSESNIIWSLGREMVLEEFYVGEEFDVDVLLSDAVAVYAKVTDNWGLLEPWFQEVGANCPSMYPESKQNELIRFAVDATIALGFQNGAFHIECRYTAEGPRLIEVNARMGGGPMYYLHRLVWGVDLIEEHCLSALKIPIRPMVCVKPLRYVAMIHILAPYSGTMNRNGWLDFVHEHPLVWKLKYLKREGDEVVGPEDGVPDWLAEMQVVSEHSVGEANATAREILEKKAPVCITAKRKGKKDGYFFPSNVYPFV